MRTGYNQANTFFIDSKVELAQQLRVFATRSVDCELFAGRQLSLAQVAREAREVVHGLTSSSDPVGGRDWPVTLGTLDKLGDQLQVVFLAVDATVAQEARSLVAQEFVALGAAASGAFISGDRSVRSVENDHWRDTC